MTTIRAVLALALLGGYWAGRAIIIFVLVVGAALAWWLQPWELAALLTAGTMLATILTFRAARAVNRCAEREVAGVVADPGVDSLLWREVRALCTRLEVRLPDEIRLGAEPTIGVWERSRRYGLRGGPRQLYLGMPLLAGLSPPQLRSLLAHELAHDCRHEGTLPAVCHRVRAAFGPLLARRPRAAGVVFALCARLFLMIERPVSREQEFRADRAAVLAAGKAATTGALRELPVLASAWQRYVTEMIAPAVQAGYAPISLCDGFNHARDRWQQELTALRATPREERAPSWDPHPSRPERMHQIDLLAEPRWTGETSELRHRQVVATQQVERELLGAAVQRVPWEEFLAITASQPLREEVAQLYQAASAVAHPGTPADIDTVLALFERGLRDDLVSELEPPEPATARRLLAVAFAQAAVAGGVARWRRHWSGQLQVVRADGGVVPVEELATRVMVDPATVPMVREVVRSVQEGPTSALAAHTSPGPLF